MRYLKYIYPVLIVIIFVYFLDIKELYEQTLFYVFQERDLARARGILRGIHIFFGPEMTGGGNLPGSIYYYLLAGSLKIYDSWISAWWLQIFMTAIGIVFSFLYIQKKNGTNTGFLWVIAISTAPLTYRFLQIFLNVSLLIPFCILSVLLINSAFSKLQNENRTVDLYLASFLIGIGLQLHYSIVILFITIMFFFIFSKKLNLYQFKIKQIGTTIFIYLLPSIPYYIWSLSNNSQQEFAINSGSSLNAISSLIYLVRFALHSEIDGILIESLRKIIFTTPFFIFLLLFAKIFNFVFNKKLNIKFFQEEYTPIYFCILFSSIPYFDWYLSSQAVRYTMPFYISLNILTVFLITRLLTQEKELIFINKIQSIFLVFFSLFLYLNYPKFLISSFGLTVILVILIAISLIYFFPNKKLIITSIALFTNVSYSQFITKDFSKITDYHWALFMPQTYEWRHIWNTIETYTGWKYSDSKDKIYYIGHHLEQSPSLYLENHKFEPVEKISEFKNPPDGFIISNRFRVQDSNSLILNKTNMKDIPPRLWAMKQNIQSELRDAVMNKELFIGKNLSDIIFIAPYWIRSNKNLPDQIHNLGSGYLVNPEDNILESVQSNIGSKKLNDTTIIFKANECPTHRKYCSNGAMVNIKSNHLTTTLKIKLIGNTISQTSPWINPDWTQAWIKPSIEILCNKKILNYPIVNSVGFLREGSHMITSPLLQANNSFVAPITKTLTIDCPLEKIQSVSLTREDSKIESIKTTKNLGKIKIDFKF